MTTTLIPKIGAVGSLVQWNSAGTAPIDPVTGRDVLTTAPRTTNVKVAVFGDSTANFGTPVDPDNQDVSVCTASLAASKIIDTTRIDKSALPYLYQQARHTVHCGVSGETTTQMLARDQAAASITRRSITDLINLAPDAAILRGGSINDVLSLTAASTQADVTAIYTRHVQILDRMKVGVPVIIDEGIFGYSPSSGTAADIAFRQAAIVTLNGLFKSYAPTTNGKVKFLDLEGILHDSTGAYLAGVCESTGVHLNNYGCYLLGQQEAALFTNLFGPSSGPTFPGSNIITNALFANTSAPGYGTTATGFTYGAASSTRQNAKIEVIDNKLFSTVEHVMTGADPYGSIYMPFTPSTMGIVANDIFGFEVDFLISTVDGSPLPVPSGRLLGQVNIAKTAAGTMTVNMCNASYTRVGYTDSRVIMHFAARIKIQEASANLNDAASNFQVQFGTAVNGTYKIGVSNPRIVGPLV